jgi:hypothetical protein
MLTAPGDSEVRARIRQSSGPLLLSMLISATSLAQAPPDSGARAAWKIGAFVGGARNSPTSTVLGRTPARDHLFIGLSGETVVLRVSALRVLYSAQLVPLVLIWGDAPPKGSPYPPGSRVPGGDVAYAFGFSPFGFKLEFPISPQLAVFASSAAGVLLFDREYPEPGAGRISFTLEFGGGLSMSVSKRQWILVGYKFHHLSNANIKALNPGVDANVIWVGYQWSVSLPR